MIAITHHPKPQTPTANCDYAIAAGTLALSNKAIATMPRLTLAHAISIIQAAQAFLQPASSPRQHQLHHPRTSSSSCCVTSPTIPPSRHSSAITSLRMSFMADSSDYKADKSDFDDDAQSGSAAPLRGEVDLASVETVEEIPVPASRNNVGNRFVAVIYDRSHSDLYDAKNSEESMFWDMHEARIALTEEHVMWARKQNLYNETFNTESMADVLWSHQL